MAVPAVWEMVVVRWLAGTYSGSATTATTATTVLTVLPLDMQVAWWSPAAPWIGTLSGPHHC